MGAVGNKQEAKTSSWRDENPRYQEKTLGGVYFYDRPDVVTKVGNQEYRTSMSKIEKDWYNKLPNYAKESVIQLFSNGTSVSGWFKIDGGVVYMNHLNGDFIWSVRQYRKLGRHKYENANGFSGSPDKYVIDDFSS